MKGLTVFACFSTTTTDTELEPRSVPKISSGFLWRDRASLVFMGVGHVPSSFDAVIGEARPLLWRAFVAVRGVDGADEATSEAMAWAWEYRGRLELMDNPIGYLYRVGLTRSISPRPEPILPSPQDVHLPDVEPDLITALLSLPERQRTAVWLVHACGWSYSDVATALDIGRSTVGTHVSRALSTLRSQLEVTDNA